MSRRKKPRYPVAASATATIDQPSAVNYSGWGWSGYAGANQTEARGQVHYPELDTRRELDQWSRLELIRKIRFLVRNEGVIRGFVKNAPRFVGLRTPRATTSDVEWNREVNRRFLDRFSVPGVFDISGKFTFWTAQPMILRAGFTDGELLTALSASEAGRAMFAFYESHQLANPKDAGKEWQDGVLANKHGRHLYYGLRDGASGDGVRLSARDTHYFGYFESPGHPRAVPPLAHAVNHMLDRMEIRADTKTGIKGASLASMVREMEANAPGGKAKDGLPGILSSVRAPNGGDYGTAKVWAGGQVIDLPPGVTAKILHDDRPSANQMEMMDSLVRDAALGFGLPPEVLYQMQRLTGPGVRLVLDLADSWIRDQQEHLDGWVSLVWSYFIAREIRHGGLRFPKDERWWSHKISGSRNLTIDRSKEMKSRLDVLESGLDTAENFCEEFFGADADDVDDAHLARMAARMEKCAALGIPYDRAFPPRQGAAAPAAAAAEEQDDDAADRPETPAEEDA